MKTKITKIDQQPLQVVTPAQVPPPAAAGGASAATDKLLLSLESRICDEIHSIAALALQFKAKHPQRVTDGVAELGLLAAILEDWRSGGFTAAYPDELPLVGAIRGNLAL